MLFRVDLLGIGVILRRVKLRDISWRGRRVGLILDILFFCSFLSAKIEGNMQVFRIMELD